MSGCFKDSLPLFEVLYTCSPSTYSTILLDKKLSKILLFGIVELAHNILFTELPLTGVERKALTPFKKFFRLIAHKKQDQFSI